MVGCPGIGTRLLSTPGSSVEGLSVGGGALPPLNKAVDLGMAPLPTLDGALIEALPKMAQPTDPNDPNSDMIGHAGRGLMIINSLKNRLGGRPAAWGDIGQ